MTPLRPWDMTHVNEVVVPVGGAVVACPTRGCGAMLEVSGPCYRCGWTLIVRVEPGGLGGAGQAGEGGHVTPEERYWSAVRREDGRREWNCPHGVGHGNHVHGCDGCCGRADFPGRPPAALLTRQTLFKVTAEDGTSCHGGSGVWSLPTQNADGTWTPGEAREVRGPLVPCENGLHLCRGDQLLDWLGPRISVAEYDTREPALDPGDKIVVTRARLPRGTPWDERIARHFACDCAERALARLSRPDPRSVEAVQVARAYADGQATGAELYAAGGAAWAAARGTDRPSARSAAWTTAEGAAWGAASAAAKSARSAARVSVMDAEREYQTDRLLYYLNGGSPVIPEEEGCVTTRCQRR